MSGRLGQTFGSTQLSLNVRPQYTANTDGSYFFQGMGASHEIKFGAGYRWTEALTGTLWPGDQVVSFDTSATNQRVRVYREGKGVNRTFYTSAYLGDTFTKNRLTANLGLRYDRQNGRAVPTDTMSNGAFPNVVPGISFAGYDSPFVWTDVSPRAGFTFALDKNRKTLLRASYAHYATQLDTGTVGYANPTASAGYAEFPWTDLNGDHLAQPNEVNVSGTPLATGAGFNPAAPTAVVSANQIDANLKAPVTNEGVFGLDRELLPNLAVSVSYTYRKFTRFVTAPRIGMTAADYTPGALLTGKLPDGSAYSVQTFNPVAAKVTAGGSGRFLTNNDDYYQTFNGIEFSATKRLASSSTCPTTRRASTPTPSSRAARSRRARPAAAPATSSSTPSGLSTPTPCTSSPGTSRSRRTCSASRARRIPSTSTRPSAWTARSGSSSRRPSTTRASRTSGTSTCAWPRTSTSAGATS
jgi:hypothetical protein